MTEARIDWAAAAPHLVDAATADRAWYQAVARELVAPGDRLAVDVGCGGAGMALALARHMTCGQILAVDAEPAIVETARARIHREWADPRIRIEVKLVDIDDINVLQETAGGQADLVWASAMVHHLGDQQRAVDALAALLARGGRLALAEGGLPARHLPWDLGVGEPGLELRLHTAEDRWFARMRAALPGSRPMPYGWDEALRRAGLDSATTATTLCELSPPLAPPQRRAVVNGIASRIGRLRDTGLLTPGDLHTWDRLLDPEDPVWLGNRRDVFLLEARSVHVGRRG
ncbi:MULTISPECIES: class I SAM-dependent methyltransferase [unclassified Micromonospora]|uniref:SAM-dependent methyltransferase n=1 Tax=unclassified Micromonospora TaxID=2617518 RepID=UPI0022B6074A|nr:MULTISPECIES: class I SAM-dependent methyltransferase [unclassified Micromonospora]MCZ7418682.1 class I SAM-dependent methyltransferase [Verrucosispora sp. WMMA2121]WBB92384.1 class I SAM-dependent methyltransferase [Verrucosispora sp. WMMC514]